MQQLDLLHVVGWNISIFHWYFLSIHFWLVNYKLELAIGKYPIPSISYYKGKNQ